MKVNDDPIIIEHAFKASKEKLWEAITNPVLMRHWFFDNIPDFKPQVGFKTQFDIKSGTRLFKHIWKVIEVEPYKDITYSWEYDDYNGKCTTCFKLSEIDGNTHLTLTALILEDFQDNIPEFKRESCVGGWNYFIKQQLDHYLNH